MPMVEKRTSASFQYRPFWGDETEGEKLQRLLYKKFGREKGYKKAAIETLNVSRRLMDMYVSSERRIPDELWDDLKSLPNHDGRRKSLSAQIALADDDDIDPLG